MNVAVVKTGPGVTWPAATASMSCPSVSQCNRSTRSARRNASRTYPLPNSTDPILRKTQNSPGRVTVEIAAAPADRGTIGASCRR